VLNDIGSILVGLHQFSILGMSNRVQLNWKRQVGLHIWTY